MIHIKSAMQGTLRRNCWVILLTQLSAAVFICMILMHWKNWSAFYGIQLSAADGFVLLQSKRFFSFVFIPLYLLLISFAVRNDFLPICILKHQKRGFAFRAQVFKTIFLTALYVVFLQIAVGLFSVYLFSDAVNWSLKNSLFYLVTLQTSDISLLQVVLYTSLFLFVLLQTTALLLLWVCWLCDSFVYAWLTEVILCIIYSRLKSDSLWNIYGVEYTIWTKGTAIYSHIIAAILVLSLLFFLGLYTSRKKDFVK